MTDSVLCFKDLVSDKKKYLTASCSLELLFIKDTLPMTREKEVCLEKQYLCN